MKTTKYFIENQIGNEWHDWYLSRFWWIFQERAEEDIRNLKLTDPGNYRIRVEETEKKISYVE